MSVFVFDNETIDMIHYILATQHFKEYTVGPQGLNQHLCALSLERVLLQTGLRLSKFQKENPREIRMHDIVRFLQQKNMISPAVASKLSEYIDFHGSLMRSEPQTTPEKANTKAQEILQFLCTEAGINIETELSQVTFEDIIALNNQQTDNNKVKIDESDFDNLSQLYYKCPSIQRQILEQLTTPLKLAPISGFTPNSAGIWIPFVTTDKIDRRALLDRASIGVAFTPNDIRIGLDFGLYSHKTKIEYYELLLNGELMDVCESLDRKATGYCLCDTFWYYHIRNIQSLQWCLTLYGTTKLAIERAIEETKLLQGTPLTANKYLVSKVIHRRPEDFTYFVGGLVKEITKDLDELYPMLARIEGL